jgi:hypothetical protein
VKGAARRMAAWRGARSAAAGARSAAATPRTRAARAALPALLLLLLAGCSAKPPVISRVNAQPILVHDISRGTYVARLAVFMVATDPDGQDDLSSFAVIDDDAELFWSVDSKTWVSATAEGESWIGTNSLSMPGGAPFPPGSYRVLLSDAGGDTAEESFAIPEGIPAAESASYPDAAVRNGTIKVTTALAGAEVWVSSPDGRQAIRYPVSGPPLDVLSILSANPTLGKAVTFWVYAPDPKGAYGLLSGPWAAAGGP